MNLVAISRDYRFVDMKVGEVVGADDEGKIKANSRVTLYPAVAFQAIDHSIIISPNPLLFERGIAQCQQFMAAGEGKGFVVQFSASKQLKLEELTYLVRIYVLD